MIEFVGGPYDGCVLFPFEERMGDVLSSLPERAFNFRVPKAQGFVPIDHDTLDLHGSFGEARYRRTTDSRWQVVPLLPAG